jgi:hypothetical protein
LKVFISAERVILPDSAIIRILNIGEKIMYTKAEELFGSIFWGAALGFLIVQYFFIGG